MGMKTFIDENGTEWPRWSILRDRREWVVWDNRYASAVGRYATRAEAKARVALANAGRKPAGWL